MNALNVTNLSISYLGEHSDVTAVRSVSFSIAQGEIFALVGESGSGKSTIAQTLLRILPPPGVVIGGDIEFNGRSLLTPDYETGHVLRWSQIAMVFQSALNALNPTLTVAGHFKDTFQQHGISDLADIQKRMHRLLKMTDLPESCAESYPHQLSGGMRQRVVIALALALEPKLVIFDEATTALDVVVEQDLLSRVLSMQKSLQFSALFITHDLALMCRIADRVGVMKDGVLLETLAAKHFFQHAKNAYTKKLIASLPTLDTLKWETIEQPKEKSVLVRAVGISKRFHPSGLFRSKGTTVIEDLNFEIHKGEVVALVGESGSGKSTVGRILCGLHPPSVGHLEWTIDSPRVQMIFQDPYGALNPVHTIEYQLMRPLVLSKSERSVSQLLTLVGLKPADALKYPHELSGGQRQRVCIARAIAGEPDLIVADEPTAMLDVSIRMDILAVMENLRKEMNISFLFITHDLTAAASFSDHLLVLNAGKIVESGQSRDIVLSPKHPYTQHLLNAANHQRIQREGQLKGEDS